MIKAHQQQYTHAQILEYWSHRFKVDVRSSQNHLYLEALKKHGKWSSSIWVRKKRYAFISSIYCNSFEEFKNQKGQFLT
jgi:hypothetical protein